jgi:hypothetical protein
MEKIKIKICRPKYKMLFVWFWTSRTLIMERIEDDCLAFQAGQIEKANLR